MLAVLAGFAIALLTGEGASTLAGRLGADYPAFYAAGNIIAKGDWDKLYNSEYQAKLQSDFFPGQSHVFLPFAYPPFVAAAYYPFSLVNYRLSYTLNTIFMFAAVFLSIWLLSPIHHLIRENYVFFAAVALSFYPMFRAVLNGQNTALTFLLITLTWRASLAKRDVLAGIALGLLLFKPQFALPLIGLYIISGRLRVGLGTLFTAFILYIISAVISGPGWIIEWYNYASWLQAEDAGINFDKAISWIGFLQAVMGWKNNAAIVIGWAMSLATTVFLVFIWVRGGRGGDLTAKLGISVAALVLIPPHVNFYDMGIVLFACMSSAPADRDMPWMPLGLLWILGFTQVFSSYLGFSLLFPVALLIFLLSIKYLAQSAAQSMDFLDPST